MDRYLLAASLFAVAGAIVYASTSSAVAHESQRTVVCAGFAPTADRKRSAWMNDQLAAGRTAFVRAADRDLCAW